MNYHVKLKMLALVAVFLFCGALNGVAQEKGITINVKNASLKEVFSVIEKQTSYRFSYRNVVIDPSKDITLSKTNATVSTVLDEVLAKKNLGYNIVSAKSIVVFDRQIPEPREKELSRRYSGTVTDEIGEPIIGANVAEKGTTNGTATDVNGNFSLTLNEDAVLQVSFIGYRSREITVGAQTNLEITLREDIQVLDEVVVVGYGTQKKAHLSGAVSTISGKAIENRPVNNANLALQGLAPNVTITSTSGNMMKTPEINVRGYTSINGGSALILVDNMPVNAAEFSRINPADIENVSVLKDAASAAIYGARAAYGVVLVTTKVARNSKLEINADFNYGIRRELTKFRYDMDLPYMMETINQVSGDPSYNAAQIDYARQRMADRSLPEMRMPEGAPGYDPRYPTLDAEGRYDYYATTDWHDVIVNNDPATLNANFSVKQRTDKLSFLTSMAYTQIGGMYIGEKPMKRYNIKTSGTYKLTDWWSAGANISYSRQQFDEPYDMQWESDKVDIARLYIKTPLKNPDGTWTESGAQVGVLLDGGRHLQAQNQTRFSFNTQFDVIKDVFVIKGDANILLYNQKVDAWRNLVWRTKTGELEASSWDRTRSLAEHKDWNNMFTTFNLYGDFHKTFAAKHFVQVLAGFNQEHRSEEYAMTRRYDLMNENFPSIAMATGDIELEQSKQALSLRGVFGRLNYTFDNRYIVEFNGRYDGTSRYAKGKRFGFFPSVTGAWIVSNEKFFEPVKELLKISFLKFRGSYGSLGNQASGGYYPYFSTMPTNRNNNNNAGLADRLIDGKRPLGIGRPESEAAGNLTWETVRTVNFGLNLGLFNDRLTVEFDKYTRYTEGMLADAEPIPGQFGAGVSKTNAADLKTKGWELDLTWRDGIKKVAGSPFTYSVRFMISDARAWITKYDTNPTKLLSGWRVGQEVGEIWGFEVPGLFRSDQEAELWHDQTAIRHTNRNTDAAGDLKFNDLNGDHKIDKGEDTEDKPGDRRIIGNATIRLPYSFDINADWKGFDLRLFFQGVGKRDWYPTGFDQGGSDEFWSSYMGGWRSPSAYIRDYWRPEGHVEGANPNGYYPRRYTRFGGGEWLNANTRYLQDASYIRLKNLTFGYTLPGALTSKWNISRLRVYFSGENLWTLSHLHVDAIDPEVVGYGDASRMYPMQKVYSFGLNLSF